jgi:hypothetical protein
MAGHRLDEEVGEGPHQRVEAVALRAEEALIVRVIGG